MTYSPKQVSTMLKIGPSTLRLYAKQFQEYLSIQDDREPGQHRMYTEQDLKILQKIKELRARHTPFDSIGPKLLVVETKPEGSSLQLIPSIAAAIDLAQSEARSAKFQADQLANQVEELQQKLDDQAREILEIKKAMEPWYKKIGGLFKRRTGHS